MSNVILTGDYGTDVRALLELLRDGAESLVVSSQLLETSENMVDRHHAKQNLERWTPIWRELDRNRGRDVQPAAVVPAAWECAHGGYVSLSYEKEGDPERAVPLFRSAAPAAAHGDEAVRALAGMTDLYSAAQEELDAARKNSERLGFILTKGRKVVIECISNGRFDVYVEEGIMGDVAYPGVRREFLGESGSPQELAIMCEAIDVAMRVNASTRTSGDERQ